MTKKVVLEIVGKNVFVSKAAYSDYDLEVGSGKLFFEYSPNARRWEFTRDVMFNLDHVVSVNAAKYLININENIWGDQIHIELDNGHNIDIYDMTIDEYKEFLRKNL